jgi:hypothetical protein
MPGCHVRTGCTLLRRNDPARSTGFFPREFGSVAYSPALTSAEEVNTCCNARRASGAAKASDGEGPDLNAPGGIIAQDQCPMQWCGSSTSDEYLLAADS